MDQLNTFLMLKIDDIKKLLDIEHSLNLVVGKLKYYMGTPNHPKLLKEAEDLLLKYNNITPRINITPSYNDLVREYIDYQIKYKYENKHSDLNNTIKLFTEDLHSYINLVIYTLSKCRTTITVVDISMINNSSIFVGSINPRSIKKIESLITDLNNLQQRWISIIEEEKNINEAEITLARDATMWRKYKHLIRETVPDIEE